MNFYRFHIGDFVSHTVHLSAMEELAYRRLLDMYYDTEQPIPLETERVSRRLRMDTKDVESVLSEFFVKGENGWSNTRCDEEIASYHARSSSNRSNGKQGGRPKKTQSVILAIPTESEPKAKITLTKNQEPRTKNIKPPISPKGDDVNPGPFDLFWQAYPKKVGKEAARRSWAKLREPVAHLAWILTALKWQIASDDWTRDNRQYVPNPATYLNQGRWQDEQQVASGPDGKAVMWHQTAPGIEAKANELGLSRDRDEAFPYFKLRVLKAAGMEQNA